MTENIDLTNSDQYILTIRVSTDGFSFSFYHTVDKLFYYQTYKVDPSITITANLRNIFKGNNFLDKKYKKIIVLLDNAPNTLIPFELFDEEQINSQYKYNFPELSKQIVLFNILKKTSVVVLFSIEKTTYQLLNENLGNIIYYSTTTPFIEYCTGKNQQEEGLKLFVNVQRKKTDIICLNRNRILFDNTFACSDTNDQMYYILCVWKLMNMNQGNDNLYLYGNNDLKNKLKKYIREVHNIDICSDFGENELTLAEDVPFAIKALYLCAL